MIEPIFKRYWNVDVNGQCKQSLKAHSHRSKANTKAKKIKEWSEEIKEEKMRRKLSGSVSTRGNRTFRNYSQQKCIPVGCVPAAAVAVCCTGRGVSARGGVVSAQEGDSAPVCPGGCLPHWPKWQTLLKTLPCRNYVADGNVMILIHGKLLFVTELFLKLWYYTGQWLRYSLKTNSYLCLSFVILSGPKCTHWEMQCFCVAKRLVDRKHEVLLRFVLFSQNYQFKALFTYDEI